MSEENSKEEVENIEEPQAVADKTVVETKNPDTVEDSKSSEEKTSAKKKRKPRRICWGQILNRLKFVRQKEVKTYLLAFVL